MSKNDFKLSTMVGENFKIYLSQMAINDLTLSTMVGNNSEITCLKQLKLILNYPTWLEKNLKLLVSNG